jgi:hypothetical protein
MPLLFYATFQPTKSHGTETVLAALALYLAFRFFRGDGSERWLPFALGATLGLLCTVRYFDGAEGLGLVLALLAFRRVRAAVEVSIGGIVTAGVLLLVPLAMGATVTLTESSSPGNLNARDVPVEASPWTPLLMLVSNRRGLLFWSPIAFVGLAGLVYLFRSRRRDRQFLVAACAMGAGLVLFYAVTPWYSGGFGFGQRFLTALMPLVALGVAGAISARSRVATAAALLCAAWSLFLMLNLVTLGVPKRSDSGALGLARVPRQLHVSPGAYLWGVRYKSNFLHWTVH